MQVIIKSNIKEVQRFMTGLPKRFNEIGSRSIKQLVKLGEIEAKTRAPEFSGKLQL